MKELIKRWVAGTPLEGVAHAAYRALHGIPAPQPPAPAPAPTDFNTLYDNQTAAIMERVLERDSNCIDVGCHVGAILEVMLRLAPGGTHYAFEPLPHLHEGLAEKYAGNPRVVLHKLALSESEGEATFQHVVTNPGYSGLLRRRFDRPHEEVAEIQVRLARLDDVIPRDASIRLMKVDVEGAELQVFKGARDLLRRCRPFVVFEHGLGAADCYGTRPEMVYDLFAACGMRLSVMGDWLETGGARTLSRKGFAEQFDTGRNYYFLAHA